MVDTKRTLNFLASAGLLANTTVSADEADAIMLQTGGTIMARGHLFNIICKKVSRSVYRLTLELAN